MRVKIYVIAISILVAINANAQTDLGVFTYQKPLFDLDIQKPVFKLNEEQQSNKSRLLRFSALTGYREGIKSINNQGYTNFSFKKDLRNGTQSVKFYNSSIEELFAWGNLMKKSSHVILNVKDSSKYRYHPRYGSKLIWDRSNAYCYELIMPIGISAMNGSKSNMLQLAEDELCRFFNVSVFEGKMMTKTLVLHRNSKEEKFKTKGGEVITDAVNGIYKNAELGSFGLSMHNNGIMPFNDETGYIGRINMELNITDWTDIPAIRKALLAYDLNLDEEMREQDVMVITEKDFKKQ